MVDHTADGMRVRRQVFSDAQVKHAEAAKSEHVAPFPALIMDRAWDHVWSRDTISGAWLARGKPSAPTVASIGSATP